MRRQNEDALLVDESLGALILADGMGGHAGGGVASALAVRTVRDAIGALTDGARFSDAVDQVLRVAIAQANQAILDRSAADRRLRGMGTTIIVALCTLDAVWLAHVGDSRAYALQAGALRRLTQDHSLVDEMVRAGKLSSQQAQTHPLRHQVLRSLGDVRTAEPDIQRVPWGPGDVLLLCSDGLTNHVDDLAMCECLLAHAARLDAGCDRLIEMANEAGGLDNITLILAQHPGGPGPTDAAT